MPRATQPMLELLHAIASCADVVQGWELSRHDDGVMLRARSRDRYPTGVAASDEASLIVKRLVPPGFEVLRSDLGTRAEGGDSPAWQVALELVLRPSDG